jgi:glycosyltransferase involved in cell wall biosynthesis
MISIIIPAHNEGPNLSKLLGQPFIEAAPSAEIIVALSPNNNDGSEKMVIPKRVRFLHCSGMGRALQMNEAAMNSSGDILAFLHADVIPPHSFVSDIERTMKESYEAGFFSYRYDHENFWLKINASFTARDGIFTGGGDQCLFIKKSTFKALGGFNIEQVLMEDFEFFDRMKKANVRYKIIKNNLIVSARKYRYNSYLRVNLSNLLLLFLFKGGYPPIKLKALHDKLLRMPYQSNAL